MSTLAWKILALFMEHTEKCHDGEYGRGYLACWHLANMLGLEPGGIDVVDIKINPRNQHEKAIKELIELGLVEEMEELHQRFRLVVKE